jgi:hypothetical protein
MIAEATSLVANLGTQGIGYINGDLTAAFSRLPVDDWICIQGDSHWASDGISVGTATLFDQQGAFGAEVLSRVLALLAKRQGSSVVQRLHQWAVPTLLARHPKPGVVGARQWHS